MEARPSGLKDMALCLTQLCPGPRAAPQELPGVYVPLICPLICFFAGKRGFGRDHVLPLLPAHSGQAHPHGDQVPESQGDGHHGLLRYLSSPGACTRLPSHPAIRVWKEKGQELSGELVLA